MIRKSIMAITVEWDDTQVDPPEQWNWLDLVGLEVVDVVRLAEVAINE